MTPRLFRPPVFLRWIYPGALFRMRTSRKELCLTFDDGPDPATTPELLAILSGYNVKALFFCKGEAAARYPDLVKKILEEGHMTGNHGYEHISGWRTGTGKYIENAEHASLFIPGNFFRPPYGRLSPFQYLKIRHKYKIVFWDLMLYDFDESFGAARSLETFRKYIRKGSVIVLHDRPGSSAGMILPPLLEFASGEGYLFSLPERQKD